MKTILCFGDSLTWGFNPETMSRYPYESRWTGILQKVLGTQYHVIEEGLNSRTTSCDDPFVPNRNGSDILPVLLESHTPIDLVVILLGTNDLKSYNYGSARRAALGCVKLIKSVLTSLASPDNAAPKILLLSPPRLGDLSPFMDTVYAGMEHESTLFSEHYCRAADFYDVHFLDTASFLTPSPVDGVHLDAENNKRLAKEVASKVSEILK